MKLLSSALLLSAFAVGISQTVSHVDYSMLAGTSQAVLDIRQMAGRTVSGTPMSLQACDEGNQIMGVFHSTAYAAGFTNAGSFDAGRYGTNTDLDSGYAAGITSDGVELLATVEYDETNTGDGWEPDPASPPFVIRVVAGGTIYHALDNMPVRMAVDGSDAYVLEQNSTTGFEVQKLTYASGAFTLDWSESVSDGSVGADIMVSSNECYVISNSGGSGEFFVLDKSAGTELSSYATLDDDNFQRFAFGPDESAGETTTSSGMDIVTRVAVVGNAGRILHATYLTFDTVTNVTTADKRQKDTYLSGTLNTTTLIGGMAMNTSTQDLYACCTLTSTSGSLSSVVRFRRATTSSAYAQGAADTPGGVGISVNGYVYMMDYSSSLCGVYQYDTTLSLVGSSTALGNPGVVNKEIAVVSSGGSDYVFWSEFISGFPSTLRAVTAVF